MTFIGGAGRDSAAWHGAAREAEVLVTGWGSKPLTDEDLSNLPRLRAIVHAAGSVKALLAPSHWSGGVRLATANEALAIGVAETCVGMIIAGLKAFFPCYNSTRAGHWLPRDGRFTEHVRVRETFGCSIGIIGASKTGRHTIRLLKGFECEVLLSDPFVTPEQAAELGVELVSLDELMRRSDVVCLHAPALESTRHLLSRRQFSLMKDGGLFLNTARGMIVDEEALVAELRTGRIFAILDVTDPEPPAPDHPFRSLENCVLLPHIAGAVSNGCLRLGRSVVDQIEELSRGAKMHGEVTEAQVAVMG